MKNFKKYFPSRSFGQNFLIDEYTIKNIVEHINPKKKQVLIEIGPGLAALTKPICQLIEKLIVIEIDSKLLKLLKHRSFYFKLIIFCQNALFFNYKYISDKKKN